MLSLFSSLWQAYKKCSTEKERELLLLKTGDNKRHTTNYAVILLPSSPLDPLLGELLNSLNRIHLDSFTLRERVSMHSVCIHQTHSTHSIVRLKVSCHDCQVSNRFTYVLSLFDEEPIQYLHVTMIYRQVWN